MKKFSLSKTDWLVLLGAICCTATVIMNIYTQVPVAVPFFGRAITDRGLFVSWIVFMVSNVITEAYSKEKAIKVSTFAMVIAFFISCLGTILSFIPIPLGGTPEDISYYESVSGAFTTLLRGQIRIVISSAIAFWIGNFINSTIIDKMKQKRKNDNKFWFAFRAIISTIIGQFVDNILFMTLAFGGVWAWMDILTAVAIGTILETIVESFFIPFVTIPVTLHIQKLEQDA